MKLGVKFSLGLGAILFIVLVQAMYSINASHVMLRQNVFERTQVQMVEVKRDIVRNIDFVRENLELFIEGYQWIGEVEQSNMLHSKLHAGISRQRGDTACATVLNNPMSRAMRNRFINYFMDTYGFTLFSSVMAVNRFGYAVAQTAASRQCDHSDDAWWRLTESNGAQVLDIQQDPFTGTKGLVVTAQLHNMDDTFVGAYKAVVPIRSLFRNLLSENLEFGAAEIDIIRKDGELIFSTRAHLHGEKHANDPIFLQTRQAKEPFVVDDRGERFIVSASWLSQGTRFNLPWLIVFKANYDELLGTSESLRNRMALVSLGALLLASLVAVYITRGVVGPVSRLCQSMTRFGQGDMDARAAVETRDELAELAATFNTMAEAQQSSNKLMANEIAIRRKAEIKLERQTKLLKVSNKELEQFAYVASHDLQEPLRIIVSYLQLLGKRYGGLLDADGMRFLEAASNGANRMRNLIRGLLEYSRITSRGKAPEFVDASRVMADVLDELALRVEEKKAEVRTGELPTIAMDPTQLHQLLINLVGNGLKYNDNEKPEVEIWAEQGDCGWLFHVRDNGIGIDSKYFERIFGVFQRLHSRAKYTGTGIGLALCKRIVERHDGMVTVRSVPGEGSTFSFFIPYPRETGDEGKACENFDG